jgi:glyoxylase-like metal-dependent hydrolase (beta-lactamase superfamily II)
MSNPDWKTNVQPMLPADMADQIPMDDLFGKISSLPGGTTHIPWDGPKVRIMEHQGHAAGSAALLVEESGILVAGDMLSDVLIPFLELDAADPTADYLAALDMFESLVDEVEVFVPGHGSVGDANEMRTRIAQDRVYVQALQDGGESGDPRITNSPNDNVHPWQVQQIAQKKHA